MLPPFLSYQTSLRSSRAALVLFVASLVALFTSFLVVPPLMTLAGCLVIRRRLVEGTDDAGIRHAAAAFATSVFGSLVALIVAGGYLASWMLPIE
jgi:hypothetical protein